ncbi:hypothetical protein P7K49_009097 [Saguinus oedipus]|uniref:Uncharacterized protein n=1 Tax=Saguinus oedipus TaxID=9490 RepID=A0ABQ9W0E1_SAGOE|nr:hypothetical protein P7K49_009097 [Saguinus oedipus]
MEEENPGRGDDGGQEAATPLPGVDDGARGDGNAESVHPEEGPEQREDQRGPVASTLTVALLLEPGGAGQELLLFLIDGYLVGFNLSEGSHPSPIARWRHPTACCAQACGILPFPAVSLGVLRVTPASCRSALDSWLQRHWLLASLHVARSSSCSAEQCPFSFQKVVIGPALGTSSRSFHLPEKVRAPEKCSFPSGEKRPGAALGPRHDVVIRGREKSTEMRVSLITAPTPPRSRLLRRTEQTALPLTAAVHVPLGQTQGL